MMRLLALVMVLPLVLVACGDKDDDVGNDDDEDSGGGDQDWDGGGESGGDGQAGADGEAGGDGDDGGDGEDGGGGSGGGALTACENYVDAWTTCVAEFGGDPADYGLTDGYCDAYDNPAYDSLFDCYAAALIAGDCSTVEGYAAAATEAAGCS